MAARFVGWWRVRAGCKGRSLWSRRLRRLRFASPLTPVPDPRGRGRPGGPKAGQREGWGRGGCLRAGCGLVVGAHEGGGVVPPRLSVCGRWRARVRTRGVVPPRLSGCGGGEVWGCARKGRGGAAPAQRLRAVGVAGAHEWGWVVRHRLEVGRGGGLLSAAAHAQRVTLSKGLARGRAGELSWGLVGGPIPPLSEVKGDFGTASRPFCPDFGVPKSHFSSRPDPTSPRGVLPSYRSVAARPGATPTCRSRARSPHRPAAAKPGPHSHPTLVRSDHPDGVAWSGVAAITSRDLLLPHRATTPLCGTRSAHRTGGRRQSPPALAAS